jgi:hypothetical protein
MTTLVLTQRDIDLIGLLDEHRTLPVPTVAAMLFEKNPFTGVANKNPLKACERRLSTLRAHGYVELDRVRHNGKVEVLVRAASRADTAHGVAVSRRSVPVTNAVHHVRTLEAVDALKRSIAASGGRVTRFSLEPALRAAEQRGRRTRRGESFEAFPDAVCTVAVPGDGGERVYDVAVEYVTSKYTDADIREKCVSFRRVYRESFWFADRPRTAERVMRVTGGTCSILA